MKRESLWKLWNDSGTCNDNHNNNNNINTLTKHIFFQYTKRLCSRTIHREIMNIEGRVYFRVKATSRPHCSIIVSSPRTVDAWSSARHCHKSGLPEFLYQSPTRAPQIFMSVSIWNLRHSSGLVIEPGGSENTTLRAETPHVCVVQSVVLEPLSFRRFTNDLGRIAAEFITHGYCILNYVGEFCRLSMWWRLRYPFRWWLSWKLNHLLEKLSRNCQATVQGDSYVTAEYYSVISEYTMSLHSLIKRY